MKSFDPFNKKKVLAIWSDFGKKVKPKTIPHSLVKIQTHIMMTKSDILSKFRENENPFI